MEYNLTISVWLIGHLERNCCPVSKPPAKWTHDERWEAMKRSYKMGQVFKSLKGITVHTVVRPSEDLYLPCQLPGDGSEPHQQVSMLIQQRHLKRLIPYLARVCKDHGIHAVFDLQTVARFNPSCDKCGRVDRRNEFKHWISTGRFVCKRCRVKAAMEEQEIQQEFNDAVREYALQHHLHPVK